MTHQNCVVRDVSKFYWDFVLRFKTEENYMNAKFDSDEERAIFAQEMQCALRLAAGLLFEHKLGTVTNFSFFV
jgi:hypothetical protein